MFYQKWELLIVDDEPDVLSFSKLAMKNFKVYGLPLKIHTASSKSDAVEFLHSRPDMQWGLAVAFIDVVMETDAAGLELCEYIREGMGNRLTQLYIRTGQPGAAPERTVIDRYNISGYFTKMEATEDKLYSLVKSGVRQFAWSGMSHAMMTMLKGLIYAADSQTMMAQTVQRGINMMQANNISRHHLYHYIEVAGNPIVEVGTNGHDIPNLRHTLSQEHGILLSPNGDKYVLSDDNVQLIQIVGQSNRVEVNHLFRTEFIPDDDLIIMLHTFLEGLAALWKQSD